MGNHNLCAGRSAIDLTCSSPMTTIVRAKVAHTPRNPFAGAGALECFEDGALAFADGRVVACGTYRDVRGGHPDAEVLDARDAILLPGFVDCHVHYPQVPVIGAMGLELMDWLEQRCLPQEALFAAACVCGLRIASGLVVSDRRLLPELRVAPARALEVSRELIERWHG